MNIRDLALKTLVYIDREQAFSNLEIKRLLNEEVLNQKDKNLLVNLVYGSLQRKITIDSILKAFVKHGYDKLDKRIKWALRLAVYQLFFLDKIPEHAIVDEAVKQVKRVDKNRGGFANGVLRNIIRHEKKIKTQINESKNLAVRYSIPSWIVKKFKESYPDSFVKILNQINKAPALTVRVAEDDSEAVFEELEALNLGPEYSKLPGIEKEAIILTNSSNLRNIRDLKLFKDGKLTVQDQGAIEISKLLEPKKGEKILDLCSAPGGKTIHLAQLAQGEAEITSSDISTNRLDLVRGNAGRLGLKNIRFVPKDATKFEPKWEEAFDKVLVDVPCSGLGVIRRRPEIRFEDEGRIEVLVPLQKKILANAYRYLKPGGELVYSTCTVGEAENEDVVNSLLEAEPEAELIEDDHSKSIFLGGDSFYHAKIKKR